MKRISIHALREEGDPQFWCVEVAAEKFLSTPSARRATGTVSWLDLLVCISIHALREEGDPYGWLLLTVTVQFLSTPSARRATRVRT